jgi:hypothetical protein
VSGTSALLALVAGAVLAGCSKHTVWTGLVYENKAWMVEGTIVGIYETLEDCRTASRAKLGALGWANGDYECGMNCKPDPQTQVLCGEMHE